MIRAAPHFWWLRWLSSAFWISLTSCAGSSAPTAPQPGGQPAAARNVVLPLPEEGHLADLRQLTFGGENAEAYWSFDGMQLILQARPATAACDRIFRMSINESAPSLIPVSSGKGATTCSYFLPGDQDVIFASTHLGGDACPPKPDHSQGYVWALHDSYDIFRAKADGTGLVRLTDTPGYDAEGTVCPKDGSIVFTSVRDGDIDLYRMDRDGKNVQRLTSTVGYDGGAFFNADCTKIVWRASRPKPGAEADEYKRLLAKRLVKPTKLEIYTANADGSDPVQITYLDAASFAPFWHPSQKRVLFSSNYGDPKGREFDLWAIDVNGTNLERVTFARGFDGFPMFSPDGKYLAFSSNRATAPGSHDTNVFVARWVDSAPKPVAELPADRIFADIRWLADPLREGRGVGTTGLAAAGEYLEKRYRDLGLAPAGDGASYRQPFPVTTGVKVLPETSLKIANALVARDAMAPVGYSAPGEAKGEVVLAGYGISAKDLGVDDYDKLNVKGKIVVVRRFVPEGGKFEDRDAQRRYGDIRHKAWTAREKGAKALIVVDAPEPPRDAPKDWKPPEEAPLPELHAEGYSDAGIPVVVVKRAAAGSLVDQLAKKKPVRAELKVGLEATKQDVFNVVARLSAAAPDSARLPGVVVLGAHYDHLGMGGRDSLAPDKHEPHLGADDNASGTAALLEAARQLALQKDELRRDILFISFSAEESGVLGSTHFTRAPPGNVKMGDVVAMINMDMVGRMRENRVSVLGSDSAEEWKHLLEPACAKARIECGGGGDGYGPSDQTPFYASGVPVVQFFTGSHGDYHKPSDAPERINAAGSAQVVVAALELAKAADLRETRLTLKKIPPPAPRGDMRSFNASLGTIPDYAGPPGGKKGVLLAGVRAGGAAEAGGLRRGDILIRLGAHGIASVEDLMYVLNASKPGERVTATIVRDGKEQKMDVTFQESHRPR
ncbi:MAG TPA: M20/M25/M40 family metallo-hydrolase [Polyangiaceae bacterium]